MYRCSSQRKKDFQPQPILVENKCLFTTQSPTMMYGVHAVQLALGDHNTNGNSRCKYHHWNPQKIVPSVNHIYMYQPISAFFSGVRKSPTLDWLVVSWVSFICSSKVGWQIDLYRKLVFQADGWLGMPGWVRRSTCFAAEMRYCNKRFAELGLGKLRQQTFRHNGTGMMVLQVGLRNNGLQMDLYLTITSYYITIERGIGFHHLFSNSIMCKKHWCRFRMPC